MRDTLEALAVGNISIEEAGGALGMRHGRRTGHRGLTPGHRDLTNTS